MAEISYRQARLDDAADIHALLLRLAAEIPIVADTLAREEALYAQVRNYARSGESWVACASGDNIVGVVLVELQQHGRHYAEHEVLDLRYAEVTPEHRDCGVFDNLVGQLFDRMLPITARVSAQNRSGTAKNLENLGFIRDESSGAEVRLRREPGEHRGSAGN